MKKAYFLADLHLGARYREDDRDVERKAVSFLDSIKEDADEIYLLGDVLDYWYEYRHVVPRGFVRFFGKLAELADAGVKITWLIGNHDIWIFDYLPTELGVTVADGVIEREIQGTLVSMQHGDAIGGDRKFRFIRKMFRNKTCQWLYSGIHPRWTVGFALGWSRRSRMKGVGDGSLVGKLREWVKERIAAGDKARYFVFGHLHEMHDEEVAPGGRMVVLPPWPEGFGVMEEGKLYVLQHI